MKTVKALGFLFVGIGPMILGAAGVGTERMVAILLVLLLEAVGVGLLVGATVEGRAR